ncbi:MAG: glycosyltransferase, partial [Patescibacteria group bacterium]
MNPLVTVLMPVYNGEKYLKKAIESILSQNFKEFEFLIIDDGSTDKSAEIIKSFNDARIRMESNGANLGLIKTLNKGFGMSKGKYIARMDCDDISLPNRLSTQVSFMEKHPEIGVCGSWVKIIGLKNEFINKYPQNNEEARAYLLFNTPLAHPAIIIRKSILEICQFKYDENYRHAEDYELWSRIIDYAQISNIPKVLLHYRMHHESVSKKNSSEQAENSNRVRLELLKELNINAT